MRDRIRPDLPSGITDASAHEASPVHHWTVRTRGWRHHPAVRTGGQLTAGERAADRLRNGMGSWTFVAGAIAFLALWMLYNRGTGFDPYPFILLNLVLSCLAALQGAILLIAARRSDQIASELATDDYRTNVDALERIAALQAAVDRLSARLPASTRSDPADAIEPTAAHT